jgi:2-polyprenyl-6-methoxyphenol hydroxylase-like FAD-dependent oxidoreductase
MNQQKICIIGDGLTGLTTAAILSKQNVSIHLYSGEKKKVKNSDSRTTAISESNFQYIKKNLNLSKNSFFWPCKKVNLFYQDKEKMINFLNFDEKNKNFMYIFQNKDLTKKLYTIISKKKNIKLIKKNINTINNENGFIALEKKNLYYDLIILSIGGLSKLYFKIDNNRSIKKNYGEVAIVTNFRHNAKIINASQFFLKEGPLAVLPFKKNIFSMVWSVNTNYFKTNKKNLKNILTQKLHKLLNNKRIKNVGLIRSFPINLNLKTKYFKKNILILGDGLHTIHPMAGQGFNLVLRDIKKLSNLMSNTLKLGLLFKDSFLLKNFYNSRKPENNLFGIGISLTNFFFKDNKYSYFKKNIIKNIKNFDFIKKISQSIADKGISL